MNQETVVLRFVTSSKVDSQPIATALVEQLEAILRHRAADPMPNSPVLLVSPQEVLQAATWARVREANRGRHSPELLASGYLNLVYREADSAGRHRMVELVLGAGRKAGLRLAPSGRYVLDGSVEAPPELISKFAGFAAVLGKTEAGQGYADDVIGEHIAAGTTPVVVVVSPAQPTNIVGNTIEVLQARERPAPAGPLNGFTVQYEPSLERCVASILRELRASSWFAPLAPRRVSV